MQVWLYSIISALIVSLISLIGVLTFRVKKEKLNDLLQVLIAFAVGGLFGDAIIHLIPESFEKLGQGIKTSLLILAGLLIFFVIEKILRWRHCHIVDTEHHYHPMVGVNIVGDVVHNSLDGMIIAASFLVSAPLGLTTTLAIVLHEIPHEMGNFCVLLYGGVPFRKAVLWNFLTALASILGVILILLAGKYLGSVVYYLIPVAAGGFLYIAGSDLIPELHHETKISIFFRQFAFMILGIVLMALLLIWG